METRVSLKYHNRRWDNQTISCNSVKILLEFFRLSSPIRVD